MNVPELNTARLTLRAMRQEDAGPLVRAINYREVWATTSRIPHPYTAQHAQEYLALCARNHAAGAGAAFVVFDRASGALIGGAGVHDIDHEAKKAELGYWVTPGWWGKGVATEAARAVAAWAFDELGLQRLYACYFAGNEASWGVQKKLGFVKEGLRRRHVFKGGELKDDVLTGVLREEFVRA